MDNELKEIDKVKLSNLSSGLDSSELNRFCQSLIVTGSVVNGQLIIDMLYDQSLYDHAGIVNFGQFFQVSIEEIINHCNAQDKRVRTASDVGGADMGDDEIQALNDLLA